MRTIDGIAEEGMRAFPHGGTGAASVESRLPRRPATPRQHSCRRALPVAFLALSMAVAGCGDGGESGGTAKDGLATGPARSPELMREHPHLSPNAKVETYEMLREELSNPPGPGDGGGRMWLERVRVPANGEFELSWQRGGDEDGEQGSQNAAPPALRAGSTARFELVFETGPLGIAEGGVLFIEADPFWDWSATQTHSPNRQGFTTASPRRPGVELEPDGNTGRFTIRGRALEPGEEIDIVYGAGAKGALVDRYAERGSTLLVGVDADGDGTRAWAMDLPRIDIVAREGVQLIALGPAEAAPGESIEISVALLDEQGNQARWPATAGVRLGILPESSLRDAVISPAAHQTDPVPSAAGTRSFSVRLPMESGTIRFRVEGVGSAAALTSDVNPIVVREASRRLRWGDLHGHSRHSDGTGRADDYFLYARDVARLDAVALTDHDHWGIRPLDADPETAAHILKTALDIHRPGEFVTIPGYEWTSWLHGHRHVLYFDTEAPIYSSLDPRTDRPDELWDALRGKPALTFAHHTAGEPVATNWWFRPDPELEPVAEIASVHGMSEAHDAPLPVLGGIAGFFVRDALMRGTPLGFIGSGDSHDGHPGLAHLAAGAGRGGLAGLFTDRLDRPALMEALKARRTFATNGIRPWFSVEIDGVEMGGFLSAGASDGDTRDDRERTDHTLRIRFEATAPIESIELIRNGIVASIPGEGALSLDLVRMIPPLLSGSFHYVRIVQRDRGVAWSSPIFVVSPESADREEVP